MEKLASRHAIAELMSWITLMENVITEDQQRILGAVGSEAVQSYLQKYKVRTGPLILHSREDSPQQDEEIMLLIFLILSSLPLSPSLHPWPCRVSGLT